MACKASLFRDGEAFSLVCAARDPPTRITLEKRGARALGFEVGLASGVDLKVEAVLPDGLLAAWNASNPQAQVSVGDRIASCNGVEGDSRAMLAELKRAQVCSASAQSKLN